MPVIRARFLPGLVLSALLCGSTLCSADPIRPKVMILATFPGEVRDWVEREKLTHSLPIPGVAEPLRYNDQGVYAMVTGTCNRSGLAVMALGLDPRFDLTHTYFMMAGIAGVDPKMGCVGCAAWARWIVDGDNVNEIGAKDYPPDWPYGILPYGATEPDKFSPMGDWSQKPMAFRLDPGLVAWAYDLTKGVALTDFPETAAMRARYAEPAARRAPFVLLGDTLGTARYWHGPQLTLWAEQWVSLYTHGKGQFVMTECEDQSVAYALTMLGKAGRVDPRRFLDLRTASNYCEPPPGESVVQSLLTGEQQGALLAFESAYRVGSPVVHALVQHWNQYESTLPAAP